MAGRACFGFYDHYREVGDAYLRATKKRNLRNLGNRAVVEFERADEGNCPAYALRVRYTQLL